MPTKDGAGQQVGTSLWSGSQDGFRRVWCACRSPGTTAAGCMWRLEAHAHYRMLLA